MTHSVQVNLTPQTQAKLDKLAQDGGRKPSDLVEDALLAYLAEVAGMREMLDRVEIEGEEADLCPMYGVAFADDFGGGGVRDGPRRGPQ